MKKKKCLPKYQNGGVIDPAIINIEKNELLVNPEGKVLKDYKNYPNHPENPNQINPMGTVKETPGNFVIPNKLRKTYLEGDRLKKQTILMNLSRQDREKRMEGGGTVPQKSSFMQGFGQGMMNYGSQPTNTNYDQYSSSYYGDTNQANLNEQYGAADSISSGLPGAAIGMGIGRGVRTRAEAMDENGNLKNEKKARRSAVLGGILSPSSAIAARSSYKDGFKFTKDNLTGKAYTDSLEANSQMDNRNNMFNEYPELFKKGGMIPRYDQYSYIQSFNRYKKPTDPNFRFYNPQPENRTSGIPTKSVSYYDPGYTDYGASFNKTPQNSNISPYRDSTYTPGTYPQKSTSQPKTGSNGVGRALVNAGLNTIGPLSYLLTEGKKYDKVNYGRLNPELLDPTESLREADLQNSSYNEDLKSGTGGNSGAYLANRLAAISKTTQNKNKIRADFSNTNIGIKNQYKNFNKDLQVKAMNDEAANKAAAYNAYYKSLYDLGEGTAGSLQDTETNEYQKDQLKYMKKRYKLK